MTATLCGDMIFFSAGHRASFSSFSFRPLNGWKLCCFFARSLLSLHCDVYSIVGLFYDLSYSRWHFHFYLIFWMTLIWPGRTYWVAFHMFILGHWIWYLCIIITFLLRNSFMVLSHYDYDDNVTCAHNSSIFICTRKLVLINILWCGNQWERTCI